MADDCVICGAAHPIQVSTRDESAACGQCNREWIAAQVKDHFHQAVPIKSVCGNRLPFAKWSLLAEESVVRQYESVAWSQVKVRCPDCDEVGLCVDVPMNNGALKCSTAEYLEPFFGWEREETTSSLVRALARVSKRYMSLGASPDDIIACIEVAHAIPPDPAATEMQLYTQRIELGQALQPVMMAVAALIPDIERRATLVLRFLRKYPAVTTMCCGVPVCFKCQTQGHHEGVTCADNMVASGGEYPGARLCPTCNAAIVLSEGCNHILCPCGTTFSWSDAVQITAASPEEAASNSV